MQNKKLIVKMALRKNSRSKKSARYGRKEKSSRAFHRLKVSAESTNSCNAQDCIQIHNRISAYKYKNIIIWYS